MKKFLVVIILFIAQYSFAQDLRTIYDKGMEAYKIGNFEGFLVSMQLADSLSPNHPTITYNLAAALAKNNNRADAMKSIKKAVMMNANLEPEADEDFASLDLSTILELKKMLKAEVSNGLIAFTNAELDLHPESVAYDPKSGDFFLNSVHKGKILRYETKTNVYTEFSSGHWAVMGMRTSGKFLWACEVATIEFQGYKEEDEGKTALLKFDLKTGRLIDRWELGGGHWFGDVILTKNGQPFISDSMQPIIYTIENNELIVFKDFTDRLFNLQGMAFNKDESKLYIADYKVGIHVWDVTENRLLKMTSGMDAMTKGTDGLYWYKNSLIAVQNGVSPFRVTRYFLDETGHEVTDLTHLDKARPELGEPTLGVLVKDQFYYLANSPWGSYKKGQFQKEGLSDNLIMKVKLD